MKIDLYTKVVLSVIAGCLVWLCVNSVTPALSAQAPVRPTPVVIVDERGTPVATAQGLRVSQGSQPWSVTVRNETIPVAVTSIERHGAWQPVLVDVLKAQPTQFPTP